MKVYSRFRRNTSKKIFNKEKNSKKLKEKSTIDYFLNIGKDIKIDVLCVVLIFQVLFFF